MRRRSPSRRLVAVTTISPHSGSRAHDIDSGTHRGRRHRVGHLHADRTARPAAPSSSSTATAPSAASRSAAARPARARPTCSIRSTWSTRSTPSCSPAAAPTGSTPRRASCAISRSTRAGWSVGTGVVPIVPAAILFDLGFRRRSRRSGRHADCGYRAAASGRTRTGAEGNVGAGAGATVGKMRWRSAAR